MKAPNEKWDTLIQDVKDWFAYNDLNCGVVGYSGGIDSATTAALLFHAGIKVCIVQICIKNQSLSSNYLPMKFCGDMNAIESLMHWDNEHMDWEYIEFPYIPYLNDVGKEAALPILRNAYLYGITAEYREQGYKPIVSGTINFDEIGFIGFAGKASDMAQDFYPISHLHKSEVKELAVYLGVPQEIIDAVPSGDLQWSGDLNDYKMIGATYDQIEAIAKFSDSNKQYLDIGKFIAQILNSPEQITLLCNNVIKNKFKYNKVMPGTHLDSKLELFRLHTYPKILKACEYTINNCYFRKEIT